MKIYPLILALFIGNACADSTPCAVPGAAPEIMLKDQIEKDTGLVTRKFPVPVVEVLSAVPAGDLLAGQLADAAYAAASKLPGGSILTRDDYFRIFTEAHPVLETVRYTYHFPDNKTNIYIAASLINDNECSVGSAGYITQQREF